MNKFYITISAWGRPYIDKMLKYCIPSIICNDNLPNFKYLDDSSFIIYTDDREYIEESDVFKDLNKIIPVEFKSFVDKISKKRTKRDRVSAHIQELHNKIYKDEGVIIFLCPDHIYSNNIFSTIARTYDRGKKIMLLIGTLCCYENDMFDDYREDNTINLSPRKLLNILMKNMHNITKGTMLNNKKGLMGSNIFWELPDKGIIGIGYHKHPIMIVTKDKAKIRGTIDASDYIDKCCDSFDNVYIVENSDKGLLIEIPQKNYMMGSYYNRKKELTVDEKIEKIRYNYNKFCTPFQRKYLDTITVLPYTNIDKEWDEVIKEVKSIIHRIKK